MYWPDATKTVYVVYPILYMYMYALNYGNIHKVMCVYIGIIYMYLALISNTVEYQLLSYSPGKHLGLRRGEILLHTDQATTTNYA